MSVKSGLRVAKRSSSIAPFDNRLTRASARRERAMPDADYAREFEQYLEATIRAYINCIACASLIHGRLQREIASMADILPDSTSLTDFACEECGRPLIRQLKHGKEGYDFFGCSGCLDGCMALYDHVDGKLVRCT